MSHSPHVAFVTWSGLPKLAPDDRLAAVALERAGVSVARVSWDAPIAWTDFDGVVLRSCWDYHLRPDAFRAWLRDAARDALPLQNPLPLLAWNLDKGYLRDLAALGIAIVPTEWVAPGERVTLADVLARTGWEDVVVKPTVSASAHATWRTSAAHAPRDDARFRSALARGPLMLQPFQPTLVEGGEWSFVFIGGAFSHAVLKRPSRGDFRVQAEFGGTATVAAAPPALLAQARRVVAAAEAHCGAGCLYARVDGCEVDGALLLLELEVLEPSLFLHLEADAPERFALAVRERL